jgi:hypothetical protein
MRFEDHWDIQEVRDCYFYHSLDLPGIGMVDGAFFFLLQQARTDLEKRSGNKTDRVVS